MAWCCILVGISLSCAGRQHAGKSVHQLGTSDTEPMAVVVGPIEKPTGAESSVPAVPQPTGLVDTPLTPLVQRLWQPVFEQLKPAPPIAAVLEVEALSAGSSRKVKVNWLLTRTGARAIELRLGDAIPPRDYNYDAESSQSALAFGESLLRDIRKDGPAQWTGPLPSDDPLRQRWPIIHDGLTSQLLPPEGLPDTLSELLRVKASFLVEHTPDAVVVYSSQPERPGSGRDRFYVTGPEPYCQRYSSWSLSSALPSTSVTPWVEWIVASLDAAGRAEPLPLGFLPYEPLNPAKRLMRVPDLPELPLSVFASTLHVAYVPDGSSQAVKLELALFDGKLKVQSIQRSSSLGATTRKPEIAAMFDPLLAQLRGPKSHQLLMTAADVQATANALNRPVPADTSSRLPTPAQLKNAQKILGSAGSTGSWGIDETHLLAKTDSGALYYFEVGVDDLGSELQVETTPLLRLWRIDR